MAAMNLLACRHLARSSDLLFSKDFLSTIHIQNKQSSFPRGIMSIVSVHFCKPLFVSQ